MIEQTLDTYLRFLASILLINVGSAKLVVGLFHLFAVYILSLVARKKIDTWEMVVFLLVTVLLVVAIVGS